MTPREVALMSSDGADSQVLNIPQAAKVLGISRNLGYELARAGKIPCLRLGRRVLVPKAALTELLRSGGVHLDSLDASGDAQRKED